MRFSSLAVLPGVAVAGLLALTLPLAPAMAQTVGSGFEVQVNPVGPGGGDLLLYPGGQFLRVVPALRHPSEAPLIRGASTARVASAAPVVRPVAPPPAPVPPPAPAPAPRVASAAPPPAATAKPPAAPPPATNSILNSLPTISMAPPPPAKPPENTGGVASTEGLSKQGVILFARDAGAPAESSLDAIRLLAGQLNGSLTRTQSRIELMAYGGNKGDRSSDARRLTLRRALAIRQILIDAGVSSTRINVHAQGGADDPGPADRVDVFIRA